MSQSPPLPDPTRWLTDLMRSEHMALWPTGDIADTAKAAAAAAAPWTKAVAEFTSWQLKNLQQLTAPWTAALPPVGTAGEPLADRRFAEEGWSKDPRFAALAKTYLTQTSRCARPWMPRRWTSAARRNGGSPLAR